MGSGPLFGLPTSEVGEVLPTYSSEPIKCNKNEKLAHYQDYQTTFMQWYIFLLTIVICHLPMLEYRLFQMNKWITKEILSNDSFVVCWYATWIWIQCLVLCPIQQPGSHSARSSASSYIEIEPTQKWQPVLRCQTCWPTGPQRILTWSEILVLFSTERVLFPPN